ncbi:MAG: N-succinyldiaminopimelate aminotransferase [Chitinophagales bacterium]|jgi:N-succinyldiaminopimelate aminotransferase
MNPDLQLLQPYPFERLKKIKQGLTPPADLNHIALSIGEPKHQPPQCVLESLRDNMNLIANYPTTAGLPELRQSIANWLERRFKLASVDALTQVLPVNGTREALFAFAQAVVDRNQNKPLVLMPNPFYQIYEGAAFLAGATPYFVNCLAENDYHPDFDAIAPSTWDDCQLLYLCSPGNPTGTVTDEETLQKLINLSAKHNFIIASDECYSELYFDEDKPPIGLLEAASNMGNTRYKNCVVFHSLSKRSNLPGLRSGFVAGDSDVLKQFLSYRTYHGCAMPIASQQASITAWNDETHVIDNRRQYREKFAAVVPILAAVLSVKMPEAGFYLWPQTPIADDQFAADIFAQTNITVLPGSFLGRNNDGMNPGSGHIRMALVASQQECIDAATRIRNLMQAR